MDTNIIEINISGEVQIGKSAVLQSIMKMLQDHNYAVITPERSERNNPSADLSDAKSHERPSKDKTVIVLTEETYSKA